MKTLLAEKPTKLLAELLEKRGEQDVELQALLDGVERLAVTAFFTIQAGAGGHRSAGLVGDAAADVPVLILSGAAGTSVEAGPKLRRAGRHQER